MRLVKIRFNLIGTNLSLVRDISAPASSISARLRQINVLDNDMPGLRTHERRPLNNTIATPKSLEDIAKFMRGSARDSANGMGDRVNSISRRQKGAFLDVVGLPKPKT